MADPRIERTQKHVLESARQLLAERRGEPLTLSTLAVHAQVSRRTLYTHWGSIDRVISDAIVLRHLSDDFDVRLSAREKLETYLRRVRDELHDPVTNAAYASLAYQASQDDTASETLRETGRAHLAHFRRNFWDVTDAEFAALIGPLITAEFLLRESASDEAISRIAERSGFQLAAS